MCGATDGFARFLSPWKTRDNKYICPICESDIPVNAQYYRCQCGFICSGMDIFILNKEIAELEKKNQEGWIDLSVKEEGEHE